MSRIEVMISDFPLETKTIDIRQIDYVIPSPEGTDIKLFEMPLISCMNRLEKQRRTSNYVLNSLRSMMEKQEL